jgi:CRP-like cAMP-binding protein
MLTLEPVILAMSDRAATPRDSNGSQPRNWLLAALPSEDLSSLRPHLEAAPLARDTVLFELDEPLTRVYFVETGVVSLLTAFDRVAVGVATVGREASVGVAALLLGGDTAPGRFQVLVSGFALTMQVAAFRSALRQSPKLRTACEAHTRALLVQMLQAVPCNRMHTVEQRCARWLLMCADRSEDDTFELARACPAGMLGVTQSTAIGSVRTLQNAGLIRYRQDAITLLDRQGLEAAACQCYRIVRDRCDRLQACALE